MIQVTKPFIPPLEEYNELLKGIWDREWLTNNGPLVQELEKKIKEILSLDHLLFLNNGTIAIQIALKALGITKEVITTPFSYVATTSSIVWENCDPVFADIDPFTFNIDPRSIAKLITDDTEAILATHCFGNPCEIEAIQAIADKHGLKVIYDAAHCFGSKYNGKSAFAYGDVSTTSFHATKLYHTVEGGAVFTSDPEINSAMSYMRNFGHDGPAKFASVGINGKNSEVHAAMGLVNLRYVESIMTKRRELAAIYDQELDLSFITKQKVQELAEINNSYYPVVFKDETTTLQVIAQLEKNDIFPRRYFYPSLSELNYVRRQSTPISDDVAKRILCLPMYHTLSHSEIATIAKIINDVVEQ